MSLPDELAQVLDLVSRVERFPKHSFFLRPGEICSCSYMVLKGCIRSYAIRNGEEKILDFYIEEEPILPAGCGPDAPSDLFLECLEDSVVLVSTPDLEERILREHPELKSVCLAMSEVISRKLQQTISRIKILSPEEQYQDLVETRSSLLQRVPQYMIASYLGIQPETLSRIRKRLVRS